jgi:hypothetical protein
MRVVHLKLCQQQLRQSGQLLINKRHWQLQITDNPERANSH